MIGGTITIECTKCGNRFNYHPGDIIAPLLPPCPPCPKCGSHRTLPSGLKGKILSYAYKKYWDRKGVE